MCRWYTMARFALFGSFALLASGLLPLSAAESKLWLRAHDDSQAPVRGIQFGLGDQNGSSSGLTDANGKTAIVLGANVKPGMSVSVTVVGNKYWIAMWNTRVVVPLDSDTVTQVLV